MITCEGDKGRELQHLEQLIAELAGQASAAVQVVQVYEALIFWVDKWLWGNAPEAHERFSAAAAEWFNQPGPNGGPSPLENLLAARREFGGSQPLGVRRN